MGLLQRRDRRSGTRCAVGPTRRTRGLGLAIVLDVLDAYGWRLVLGASILAASRRSSHPAPKSIRALSNYKTLPLAAPPHGQPAADAPAGATYCGHLIATSLCSSSRGFSRPQSGLQSFRDLTTDLAARISRSVEIDIKFAIQKIIVQGLGRRLGQNRGALDRTVVTMTRTLMEPYLPTPAGPWKSARVTGPVNPE